MPIADIPAPSARDTAIGDERSFRRALRAFIPNVVAVWLVTAVAHTLLFVLVPGTAWRASELSTIERLGLLAFGIVSCTPAAAVTAACLTIAFELRASASRALRALAWGALAVALLADLFVRTSWAMFFSTRQFMNAGAWRLSFTNPSQLMEHVQQAEPWMLLAVPAVSLAIVLTSAGLCLASSRWPRVRSRRVVRVAGAAWLAILAAALGAQTAASLDTRRVSLGPGRPRSLVRDVYATFQAERSGAGASLLAQAWDALDGPQEGRGLDSRDLMTGNAVISPAQYIQRVDQQRFRRLSVIVVMVESLRADELTALGGKRAVMPTVEGLASEGTVYTRMVSPAGQTDYATTSTLSSQFPLRWEKFHVFPRQIGYPHVLLWDVLQPLGYRTAVFSSQNERWNGMFYYLSTGTIEHFLHSETFQGPTYAPSAEEGFRDWMAATGHAGKIDDRYTINEAIAWTDSIAPDAPFVAYVNLQSSHTPYERPARFAPRFGSGKVSFPILFNEFPRDSANAVRDMYDNSLAYADEQLGRLVASLKRSGRWNSTVLVVMGDHGEAFYEHGFAGHASELYGEVTHVPLVIRVPGRAARVDTVQASSIDLAPTLLGILRLPPHAGFADVDLANVSARVHRPVFSISQSPLADEVSVTQDGWKLSWPVSTAGSGAHGNDGSVVDDAAGLLSHARLGSAHVCASGSPPRPATATATPVTCRPERCPRD